MFIVIVGSFAQVLDFFGPFDSKDKAIEWAQKYQTQFPRDTKVVELLQPFTLGAEHPMK